MDVRSKEADEEMRLTKTAISKPRIGDRVRLAFRYRERWRPLFWVRVGRDGSIYTGLLMGRPSVAQFVTKPASKLLSVKYTELVPVRNVPKSSRVSFKASGEIHYLDMCVHGSPLETIARPRQLCLMQFAHPSQYLPLRPAGAGNYDIRLANYIVDEECPAYGALIVEPFAKGRSEVAGKLPNMTTSAVGILGFRGLTRTPDLLLQLIVGHGPRGSWPDLPLMGVRSKD